ncbi:MAG: DUF2007 domain-containing protein [Candidatus Rokubacteria bacterium]|nr:DUF2007 domain-containing protein [Candidatus Rokubacteria bacterium]
MKRRGRVIPFPTDRTPRPGGSRASRSRPLDERAFVEVHRCDQAEALVVKSLFESEGIPTLLRSRLAHSVHPFTVGSQGEIVILVPRDDAARARRRLKQRGIEGPA